MAKKQASRAISAGSANSASGARGCGCGVGGNAAAAAAAVAIAVAIAWSADFGGFAAHARGGGTASGVFEREQTGGRPAEAVPPFSASCIRIDGAASPAEFEASQAGHGGGGLPAVLTAQPGWRRDVGVWEEKRFLAEYGGLRLTTTATRHQVELGPFWNSTHGLGAAVLPHDQGFTEAEFSTAELIARMRRQWEPPAAMHGLGFTASSIVSVGRQDQGSVFHHHAANYLLLLAGRKTWWLIEPDAAAASSAKSTGGSRRSAAAAAVPPLRCMLASAAT